MAPRDLGDLIEEEWERVDPEDWVVEPTGWSETSLASPFVRHRETKQHLWQLLDYFSSSADRGFLALPAEVSQPEREFQQRFRALADEWRRETIVDSSIQRRAMHRAYQHIIGMGRPAVPLILAELRREPDYWFWALTAITSEDPARNESTLAGARARWLEWADQRGL
jgi:hypothetical protein